MKWNEEHRLWLLEWFPKNEITELVVLFNNEFGCSVSKTNLYSFIKRKKIKSGRTGHFEKGSVPWCTGTKGILKGGSTSFKKGNIPHNVKPIGHERVNCQSGHIEVKVGVNASGQGNYKFKHRLIWEQAYGPIPKGKVVQFIDGNKLNFDLSNLELIDRKLLLRLNWRQVYNNPPELVPTLRQLTKLEVKVHELQKKSGGRKC